MCCGFNAKLYHNVIAMSSRCRAGCCASLSSLRSARDPSHFAASSESGMFISLHSWLQRRTLRVYSRLYSWLRFQLALSTMIRGEHCTSEGGIKCTHSSMRP